VVVLRGEVGVKRLISALVLVMLMVSMFALAFSAKPARSSPATITVPDDYSTIQAAINAASSGDTVYVKAGTYRENVVVGSKALSLVGENPQSTIIDGGGTGDGIRITGDGVSVRGFMIRNDSSQYFAGIHLERASHCNITGNNITDDWVGIGIFDSDSNFVFGNNIAGNQGGIVLFGSGNMIFHNSFVNNTLFQASVGFCDSCPVQPTSSWDDGYPSGGNYWSDYNGTDVYSGPYQNETGSDGIGDTYYPTNYVPLLYRDDYPLMQPWAPFEGQTIYIRADGSIDPSGAPVQRKGDLYTLTGNITSDSNGIVIERDNMTLDGAGYTLQGEGNGAGIDLSQRTNVTVQNTQITAFYYGIALYSSSNNTVSANNMTADEYCGISLQSSDYNTFSSNIMTDNYDGIWLVSSSNNTIYDNTATNNGGGIVLIYSSNNTVFGNTAINNYAGVYLYVSSGSRFFHNNFIGNFQQVSSSQSANVWDNGYPSGGNYWSNCDGTDSHNGPYQNITGSDGIGDTPYVIDANNTDHYPLMNPVIPEFPSAIILPSFLLLLALAITIMSKKSPRKP